MPTVTHVRAERREAAEDRSYSQSSQSNLADPGQVLTVAAVLAGKGHVVHTVAPEATVAEAVAALRARGIGALVVVEGGALVGILSERDVVRRLDVAGTAVMAEHVAALMTPDPETCGLEDPVLSVLARMSRGRFRHMPVLDHGQLIGLISIGDVVMERLRQLEYEALRMKQMIVG